MDGVKKVFEWFNALFTDFNGWMKSVFKFDYHVLNFYEKAIIPLPEWMKLVGLFFLSIALVLGIIQLIKKVYKLVVVLLIIFIIIILITWL